MEGSLSKAGEFALAEGLSILQALRENRTDTLLMTTDIPPTSTLMRPGLWASLASLKDNGGIESSPRELTFSEVKLIWAASKQCQSG